MIGQFGTFEFPLSDRFRFEAELGRGAMGTVYRAHDLRLDRIVAIKMLDPALGGEAAVLRFQSEIRIAAGLRHPNIISVHDSGEAGGRLYYVMDYLGGETLRSRLAREKQLPIEDAIQIAGETAAALQFAHDRGVVHRDIKPENIILAGGEARVVDFGLARAFGDNEDSRLTATGLSVGTPQYLSPEQASAERNVGPHADQYGLACVVYEMIAGEPPFTGPTAMAVAMRHLADTPARLATRRRATPANVDDAVSRGLEKVPADRFRTIGEFAGALRDSASASVRAPARGNVVAGDAGGGRRRRTILATAIIVMIAVATAGVAAWSGAFGADSVDDGLRWVTRRPLDTTRYVVLPFTQNGDIGNRVRDGLARWSGVSTPAASELRIALAGHDVTLPNAARAVARSLGAGRIVTGDLEPTSGGPAIRVDVMDPTARSPVRTIVQTVPNGNVTDSIVSVLVYRILYGDGALRFSDAARGTASRPAFLAYLRGRAATGTWNLVAADSAFADALRFDSSFPQAALGLAQVREWMHDDVPGVEALVSRALDGASRLSVAGRLHASALSDLLASRYPLACARYDSLLRRDSLDFGGWFGIAECNRRDDLVIPNQQSPSGRAFRGSRNRGSLAIQRAFTLLASVDPCCSARADATQRRFLITSTGAVRVGQDSASEHFMAFPELGGDTISLLPRRPAELQRTIPTTNAAAVRRQQQVFLEIATRRLTQSPNEPSALEEFGQALELLGRPGAADTLRRARTVSTNQVQRTDLGVREAWIRFKLAAPGDLAELRFVRIFAESLFAEAQTQHHSDSTLASLAVLIDDAPRAVRLAGYVDPADALRGFPSSVVATAQRFTAYAAMGGPVDSLRDLDGKLASAIENQVVLRDQPLVRTILFVRPATLAFPVYQSPGLARIESPSDLVVAERAFAKHDITSLRRILDELRRVRERVRPADRGFDVLYPEAWLRTAIGDTIGAMAAIRPSLDALASIPADRFLSIAVAGALRQSMILLARLERAVGDRATANRWSDAVTAVTDTTLVEAKGRRARSEKTPP